MIICPLYLSRFHPPSHRVDILVFLFFFVSYISSPASRTIPSFPCDALIIPIDSDSPSVLKRKRQARIQVCLCVFSFPVICFIWTWLLTAGKYRLSLCPTHICILWFYVNRLSHALLKSINSSGGKLNFPWYNLLCYSSWAVSHSTSMYKLFSQSVHCV